MEHIETFRHVFAKGPETPPNGSARDEVGGPPPRITRLGEVFGDEMRRAAVERQPSALLRDPPLHLGDCALRGGTGCATAPGAAGRASIHAISDERIASSTDMAMGVTQLAGTKTV